jgi:hypothetical protein
MAHLNPESLAATVDAVNESLFFGRPIPVDEASMVVDWLGARLGAAGSYRGLPALTPIDFAIGLSTFTGERLRTRASTAHVMGEEACTVMLRLGGDCARDRLDRIGGFLTEIRHTNGHYCCGTCSVSLWRHLIARGDHDSVRAGLSRLREHRKDGGWSAYPFHYTVFALTEVQSDEAKEELAYAAPRIRRALARVQTPRRRAVMERAVEALAAKRL